MDEVKIREGISIEGNSPGHAHKKPGIWDWDNGELAGKECAQCKAWNDIPKALSKIRGEK